MNERSLLCFHARTAESNVLLDKCSSQISNTLCNMLRKPGARPSRDGRNKCLTVYTNGHGWVNLLTLRIWQHEI